MLKRHGAGGLRMACFMSICEQFQLGLCAWTNRFVEVGRTRLPRFVPRANQLQTSCKPVAYRLKLVRFVTQTGLSALVQTSFKPVPNLFQTVCRQTAANQLQTPPVSLVGWANPQPGARKAVSVGASASAKPDASDFGRSEAGSDALIAGPQPPSAPKRFLNTAENP